MLWRTSEARVLLQGLRVHKFHRILVFGYLTNLDYSSVVVPSQLLGLRNVVFTSANKPTTHVPMWANAIDGVLHQSLRDLFEYDEGSTGIRFL